ncbi:MAG: hypothetical protein ACFFDY_01070 [Candidatus Thorarchaeota archaeon]
MNNDKNFNYNQTIKKFKRGAHEKLEAAHELILSIHSYIAYLMQRNHNNLFLYHCEDAIAHAHLYLLDKIHKFDPERGRFICWSRGHILNSFAIYYGKYVKPITVSKMTVNNKDIRTIYIGVPDHIDLNECDIETKIYNKELIANLKKIIIKEFGQHYWLIFNDYCGFSGKKITMEGLAKKYHYNSYEMVQTRINKIRKFLKPQLGELL